MAFYVETHMHTKQSSRCGRSDACEMVRAYHAAGYSTLVITDHFVNGNCTDDKDAPWKERIDTFLAGYRAARDEGERLGMVVLLGWEWTYAGEDYLTYGLNEVFLYGGESTEHMQPEAYCALVRDCGGLVVQAHPFRKTPNMNPEATQRAQIVDGIEVINGSLWHREHPEFDAQALALCVHYGRIQTAGSDAHGANEAARTGMVFDCPIGDNAALVQALRGGKGRLLAPESVAGEKDAM